MYPFGRGQDEVEHCRRRSFSILVPDHRHVFSVRALDDVVLEVPDVPQVIQVLVERPSALLDLAMVRRKPIPCPPEPLRRAAVALVTGALRRVDAGGKPGAVLRDLERVGISFSS